MGGAVCTARRVWVGGVLTLGFRAPAGLDAVSLWALAGLDTGSQGAPGLGLARFHVLGP